MCSRISIKSARWSQIEKRPWPRLEAKEVWVGLENKEKGPKVLTSRTRACRTEKPWAMSRPPYAYEVSACSQQQFVGVDRGSRGEATHAEAHGRDHGGALDDIGESGHGGDSAGRGSRRWFELKAVWVTGRLLWGVLGLVSTKVRVQCRKSKCKMEHLVAVDSRSLWTMRSTVSVT